MEKIIDKDSLENTRPDVMTNFHGVMVIEEALSESLL